MNQEKKEIFKSVCLIIVIILLIGIVFRLVLGFWPFIQKDPFKIAYQKEQQSCVDKGGIPYLEICLKKDSLINN